MTASEQEQLKILRNAVDLLFRLIKDGYALADVDEAHQGYLLAMTKAIDAGERNESQSTEDASVPNVGNRLPIGEG